MTRKVELERMTWREVEAVDKAKSVVLLPIGVLEQHGPGGPMGIDYVLAHWLAVETAKRLDGVYVAPTITYGYSPTFANFPGNLGIRFETLKALIGDVVDALVRCGWRNIIFFDNHGGNEPACEWVGREAREKHGIVIGNLYPWRLAMHLCNDLYRNPKAAIGHGAEPTISIMMALLPDGVDRAALEPGVNKPLPGFEASNSSKSKFDGFEVGLYVEADLLTPNGASGDPSEASPEKGHEILRRMVEYTVRFVPAYRELVTRHLAR